MPYKKKPAAAAPSFTLVSVPFLSLSSVNILYIGAGFVGACSAAVSADSGHRTLVYDIDERRIAMLGSGDRDTIENCLFEEGLGDLLVRNRERIELVSDYRKVESFLDVCDAVFMCLPTPEIGETGASDLSYYNAAADRLAKALARRNKGRQTQYVVLVNKSTVPVVMVDRTAEILRKRGVRNFGIVSNPEFLVEGKAVSGSLKPDRIVVGAWRERDFAVMRRIYQRFVHAPGVEYVEVNPKEAAAGKLLANFVLFSKLAVCFDVIGRTCEAFPDLQFENVRRILAGDPRIGSWGLYNSLYAGGSCLIKDARSLSAQLKEAGKEPHLVNETYLANRRQLLGFLDRAEKEAGFSWAGKKVALLGVAFKRSTNDIRNTPAIDLARVLSSRGTAEIRIYDPAAMDSFKVLFPPSRKIKYFPNEARAVDAADAVIIATDWPQFRGLGELLRGLKGRPLIMDGRRMLQHFYPDLRKAGFSIIAVGSAFK
ncbi:MAG: nucleotide sugar dehydrogenase [Candidatus Aminicenantes bacterium]|nr:nucleotide sugar dehydrogenase [Candidatus Aminicenantes bacterium]